MLKYERKLIEWVNLHMVQIAILFVIAAAAVMRIKAVKYMGIDYHYSLYDIPGNCNSLLYRSIVSVLMRNPDWAIILLKVLAYLGDFGTAFMVLLIFYQKEQKLMGFRSFLCITACLLAPVTLVYSATNMEPDSIAMCLVLSGVLVYQKKSLVLAVPLLGLAAFFYPPYWLLAVFFLVYIMIRQRGKENGKKQMVLALLLMLMLVIGSVFLENTKAADGFYWGKIFVVDPNTGEAYADLWQWLLGMVRIYGYAVSIGLMLASFKYKKLRIPALVIQLLVVMYVGWITTSHHSVFQGIV